MTYFPVRRLHLISRPSAVFFTVVLFAIFTVYGCVFLPVFIYMAQIGLVHIVAKLLKGNPLHLNALATIIIKSVSDRVIAPLPHTFPYFVKACLRHSVGSFVSIYQTSTAISRATKDIMSMKNLLITTIASKPPSSSSVSFSYSYKSLSSPASMIFISSCFHMAL